MKFGEMIEILQEKEKGYIVLINSGGFYVARGKDAIQLNKILKLKLTCMEKEICKIGFPINVLEKYKELIKKEKYSYIIYNFNREKNKLEIIEKYTGEFYNKEENSKRDCKICKNVTNGYIEDDKYLKAIEELYRGEEFEGEQITINT